MPLMPIFKTDAKDHGVICQIIDRACRLAFKHGIAYSRMDAQMDVEACHSNGCPIQWDALLLADDANFAHDIFGIRRHIDRNTGTLRDFFIPRFAVKKV